MTRIYLVRVVLEVDNASGSFAYVINGLAEDNPSGSLFRVATDMAAAQCDNGRKFLAWLSTKMEAFSNVDMVIT